MQDKIQLRDFFAILKRRWLTIFLVMIVASMSITTICFYVLKPTYQASTQVLVSQATSKNVDEISNITQLNTQLISSYIDFIKSPMILNSVKEELNLKVSFKELNEQITIDHNENSQFITITVRNEDPKAVSQIANKIAVLSKDRAMKLMKGSNIQVLTEPSQSLKVFPKPLPVAAVTIVVSLMMGIGAAMLREYLDNAVRSEQEIQELIGLPIVGHMDLVPRKIKRNQEQSRDQAKARRENLEL